MLSEAIDFEMNAQDKKGYQMFFSGYGLIGCCQKFTINSVKF
jgi:hypothetical protein